MARKQPTKGKILADLGDLIAFPDGGGWIVGVLTRHNPTTVCWGDCTRQINNVGSYAIPRNCYDRGAGVVLGKRFDAIHEVADTVRPFRRLASSTGTLAGTGEANV